MPAPCSCRACCSWPSRRKNWQLPRRCWNGSGLRSPRAGTTPLAAALGFVLSRPEIDVAVVGMTGLQQFNEIVAAALSPCRRWTGSLRAERRTHPDAVALVSYASSAATCSAMASEAVRPGDSIPNRLTSPGRPCACGSVDAEIGIGFARSRQFGPHPGIIRRQHLFADARPVTRDNRRELGGDAGRHGIVDLPPDHSTPAIRHWGRSGRARPCPGSHARPARPAPAPDRPDAVKGLLTDRLA